MTLRALYLEGDPCSTKYVGAGLRRVGVEVEEVVEEAYEGGFEGHDVVLLSDYEARLLGPRMDALARAVEGGVGLVAVGGWFSFGRGGYAESPLARVLPVEMQAGDDRVTRPGGAFLSTPRPHEITRGLPFDRPAVVTGWNHLAPRAGAEVVLEARSVERVRGDRAELSADAAPVLVTGTHGRGRVAAVAVDLAPHWSGGWTDWGEGDLVPVTEKEQVGSAYLRFLAQLVAWSAAKPVPEEARALVT